MLDESLSQADSEELASLVSMLELSDGDGTTIVFAVAPDIAPRHPVVAQLKSLLAESEEGFQVEDFFISDNSLTKFLYGLTEAEEWRHGDAETRGRGDGEIGNSTSYSIHLEEQVRERRLLLVYGLERLPTPRRLEELRRLNLGRDLLFQQQLVLIFWLNREEFLSELRYRAPDFWDWRGKVANFETRPLLDPVFYPYLEWLIGDKSYLKISGVMQVQRQVDIFLDQVYISLQGVSRQEVAVEVGGKHWGDNSSLKSKHVSPSVSWKTSSDSWDGEEWKEEFVGPEVEPVTVATKKVTTKVDLAAAVRDHQYSVILGDPGAGKTTLLNYLALHQAQAQRDGKERVQVGEEDLGEAQLPVFLRIADYAEQLAQQPELSLLEFLEQFYQLVIKVDSSPLPTDKENNHPPIPSSPQIPISASPRLRVSASQLSAKLQSGQCIVLLDGLDEVFDQSSRKGIVKQIEQLVGDYPYNKYVITSRIAGYKDVKLSDRFSEFTITDMAMEQVEQFLQRWCLAIEKAQKPEAEKEFQKRAAEEEAQELLKAIQGNEGVKRLTGNPLLLTILALIHRNGSRLPQRRVEVYALAVKTLIEDWQLHKKLPEAPQALLKESEVMELLAPLAYWMHEHKPAGLVSEAEVIQQLSAKLAELSDEEPESETIQQDIEQFLRKVRETTGLFVERAPGFYGFMHLTFEEYFAARQIADNGVGEILDIITPKIHESRWREPILLALGYLGSHTPKQANRVVKELFRNLEEYQPTLAVTTNNPTTGLPVGEKHWGDNSSTQPNMSNPNASPSDDDDLKTAPIKITNSEQDVCATATTNLQELGVPLKAGGIKIKNPSSEEATLIWSKSQDALSDNSDLNTTPIELEFPLRDLKFAAEVVAQVEVNSSIRKKVIDKLVVTVLGLDTDFEDDVTKQLLRLLRQIELFNNNRTDVTTRLQQGADDLTLSDEIRVKAKLAILYIACGEVGAKLANQATAIVSQLEPTLFCEMKDLVAELGEEMTPALETTRQHYCGEPESQKALTFLTAMSYLRTDKYDQAIALFKEITEQSDGNLSSYIDWALASCYQAKDKFEQAVDYYQQCFEKLEPYIEPTAFLLFWSNRGVCHRLHSKYEKALDCFQKMLKITREIHKPKDEAFALYHIGRSYQEWGKYEEAIAHHQQSLQLYEQLDLQQNVANQWYWLSDCYCDWGKYEQALDHQQQCLKIRQQLENQSSIASAHFQLGYVNQAWGKYEDAITQFNKSRQFYEQLERKKNVANQWNWLAVCYRKLGKYEQAIECELKDLAIRQQLDDQPNIAYAYYQLGRIHQEWGKYKQALEHLQQCLTIHQQLEAQADIASAYFQLGRINQDWGKYEQAIAYYQQSLQLYEQLEKQKDVANIWYWIGDCYRKLGKYEQAVEFELKDLAIRQQLNDKLNIADAYWQLGRIYQDWGKYEDAIAYYQQSRQLYEQLALQQNVANQWNWLADCYRVWGKYEQAVEFQFKNLAICKQLDDQPDIADAYFQLGRIYQNWGKYEQAIAYYQQSRQLYEQLEQQKDIADLWYNLAGCYREWCKYEQAVECELKDLAIRQQLDDQPNIASAYFQLGRIYQDWEKYEQAITQFQQSYQLYEQLELQKDLANLWYWLGDCYCEWGKYEQAIEHQQQCLKIRKQLEDQSSVALAYHQLGRIYQDWGKCENAIAQFQQSLQLYEQLEKQKNVANQWYWLAVCYQEWGKYEQAVECELKDLAIHQQLDDQQNIADAYFQLGRIYQDWGKYEQAIAYHQQSRELYEQLEKQKNVANQCYWLAICYREWGKYEQAIEFELKDLAIRQQLDDQPNIADAYKQLGKIYQEWGKYEEAIAYHQQSRQLYEQLDLQEDVANLWSWIAKSYRDAGDYTKAIEYYQQSYHLHQQLSQDESTAKRLRQIGKSQCLLAKNTPDRAAALDLLNQAEENIHQAIQLDTAGEYKQNLAYDYTTLGLLWSERLRLFEETGRRGDGEMGRGEIPHNVSLTFADDLSLEDQIAQFEECYHTGFTYFTELGQIINRAEEALDMARAYLEIPVIENRDKAEAIAQESLQIFQEYNRYKLAEAAREFRI
ncbi:MAG: tetratricopeptide repeat protein [Symploca sp. SIO1A3]|nr:tetratricopeptide repeat protein [Symploca sp. SIO1A3]